MFLSLYIKYIFREWPWVVVNSNHILSLLVSGRPVIWMHSGGGPGKVQCRLSVFLPIFTSGCERVRSGYTWGLAGNLKAFQCAGAALRPSRKSKRGGRPWSGDSITSCPEVGSLVAGEASCLSRLSRLRPLTYDQKSAHAELRKVINKLKSWFLLQFILGMFVFTKIHVCCLRIAWCRLKLPNCQIALLF